MNGEYNESINQKNCGGAVKPKTWIVATTFSSKNTKFLELLAFISTTLNHTAHTNPADSYIMILAAVTGKIKCVSRYINLSLDHHFHQLVFSVHPVSWRGKAKPPEQAHNLTAIICAFARCF